MMRDSRDIRMARRMSHAPRMSVVFTTPIALIQNQNEDTSGADESMADEQELTKSQSLRNFCYNNVKSIVTCIMILGMVFCIVMIVLVHKWNFEKKHGPNWSENTADQEVVLVTTRASLDREFIHEQYNNNGDGNS